MKRALIIFLLLLAAAFTPFVPQLIGYVSTSIRKTGIVIDDETGRPMANVIVVAAGWFSRGPVGFGPGVEALLYRVVTRTDDGGRYEIPAEWSGYSLKWPGADPEYRWVITVFQVGYAVVGDKPDQELLSYGSLWYETPSITMSPSYTFKGLYFEVEPLRMFKPTLNLKEVAIYYASIKSIGRPQHTAVEPGDIAMRQQGYDLLAPWVCGFDPNLEIEARTRDYVVGFSHDIPKALNQLAEQSAKEGGLPGTFAPSTKAGMVCAILTNGRGAP